MGRLYHCPHSVRQDVPLAIETSAMIGAILAEKIQDLTDDRLDPRRGLR